MLDLRRLAASVISAPSIIVVKKEQLQWCLWLVCVSVYEVRCEHTTRLALTQTGYTLLSALFITACFNPTRWKKSQDCYLAVFIRLL